MVKRSTINVNFVDFVYDYQFIDHIKLASNYGPISTSWATGAVLNSDLLDASGWPNHADADARQVGSHILIPASTDFAGPYVLTWTGDGEVQFTLGTWTINAGASSGYAEVSNGRYTGTNARIVLTYSGIRQQIGWRILRTDRSDTSAWLRDLKFYRLEDEADLQAGKIFRTTYKQTLIDLNPSCVRLMNWTGGNNSHSMRFEHRNVPSYLGWAGNIWVTSPPYGETTGTNQYSLSAATGTPSSMQHGEFATCRIGNTQVRCGAKTVTAITKASPGVVTATAHGFQTGDKIIHSITAGMTQLNLVPCTITVSDANTYSIGVDTSAFSNFTAGSANQYITLQVGSGNDRVAYPVVFEDGSTPAANYSNGYIVAADYKTFYFDKKLVGSTEVNGAWIFNNQGASLAHSAGVPLEICTAFMNELNEMATAQSRGPIDMWVCIPHRGLLSMDPDYSAGSNFAVGTVDVILNGANGYSGLTALAQLFVENSNETWNRGSSAFSQTYYYARLGQLRYADAATNDQDYSTLRSVIMTEDVRAAFPSETRIKFVQGLQGSTGLGVGVPQYRRVYGGTNFDNDVLNVWGDDPIDHHDLLAWAGYFLASSSFHTTNAATMAATYAAATTDAAREAACAAYVAGVVGAAATAETVLYYQETRLPEYNDAMALKSKQACMYEGGWDRSVTSGTAEVNTFLKACKTSRAWANAMRDFMDAFDAEGATVMPAGYVQVDERWGHAYPDMYSGAIEGGALDLTWEFMGLRNRGKRQILIA